MDFAIHLEGCHCFKHGSICRAVILRAGGVFEFGPSSVLKQYNRERSHGRRGTFPHVREALNEMVPHHTQNIPNCDKELQVNSKAYTTNRIDLVTCMGFD